MSKRNAKTAHTREKRRRKRNRRKKRIISKRCVETNG
jgi:hypothetical protein